jgi:hypothetical protein
MYSCEIIEQGVQPTFCIPSCFANGTKFLSLFVDADASGKIVADPGGRCDLF